jgi:hypothetical protein
MWHTSTINDLFGLHFQVVHLNKRKWIEASTYPHFTMIGLVLCFTSRFSTVKCCYKCIALEYFCQTRLCPLCSACCGWDILMGWYICPSWARLDLTWSNLMMILTFSGSFLFLSGLLGALSWSLMATLVSSKYSAAFSILLGSLSAAFSDVVSANRIFY